MGKQLIHTIRVTWNSELAKFDIVSQTICYSFNTLSRRLRYLLIYQGLSTRWHFFGLRIKLPSAACLTTKMQRHPVKCFIQVHYKRSSEVFFTLASL